MSFLTESLTRDNKYLMQLKPGAVTYICVDDNGMLLSINGEEGVARPAAPGNSENPDPVNIREYLQYVDEDFVHPSQCEAGADARRES